MPALTRQSMGALQPILHSNRSRGCTSFVSVHQLTGRQQKLKIRHTMIDWTLRFPVVADHAPPLGTVTLPQFLPENGFTSQSVYVFGYG